MSSPGRLASFCRLCLAKIKDKVPVFADGKLLLENLLHLIEIEIDPDEEPEAVVCLDCIVTLEGFLQFKEQCHVNDAFVKTVPVKVDGSVPSVEVRDEKEDDAEGSFEEEDYLEVSDAEEEFPEIPEEPAKKSPKKLPAVKPSIVKATTSKKRESAVKPSSKDVSQVLAKSYPDSFYFEKSGSSIYYTLVFRGDRYNSALFAERSTYWQCIHRKKYQCPAQLEVTNDYKKFEKRYEHTHEKLPAKKGKAFTPQEALPEIFQLSKLILLQKQEEIVGMKVEADDEPADLANKSESSLLSTDQVDSVAEAEELVSNSRPKRKIKPNPRYAVEEIRPKKHCKTPEPEMPEQDEEEPEEDDTVHEEDVDLDKLEEECKDLKIRKRSKQGPSLDEQLVLADSYPDFFFFEKVPRSVHLNFVYYGERFYSPIFTEYYTYWHCVQRRRHKCTAQVRVANDYQTFERRYEHNHPDVKVLKGKPFTPMEALPQIFEDCRNAIFKKRAKLRKKLLEKHKYLQTVNSSVEEQDSKTKSMDEEDVAVQADEDDNNDELSEKKSPLTANDSEEETEVVSHVRPKRKTKPEVKPKTQEPDEEEDLDMDKLDKEWESLNIRKRAKMGPSLDEQLVLADSYPDYFFFEKVPRSTYFNFVYYGERFFAPIFTEYYTYWHCRQRRRRQCEALVRASNDYKTFERRYEHNHPDIPAKEGEALTPLEALPTIFDVCRKTVLKTRAKRRMAILQKHKISQIAYGSKIKSIEQVNVAAQDDEEDFYDEWPC